MSLRPRMRAAVLAAPRRFELVEVDRPEPGPGEVRVRVEGCGVCGSNLVPWQGREWFQYPFAPGAMGHEGWGRIDAVGRDVSGVEEGERVAILSGAAFAEYDVAPADRLVTIPDAVEGAFPGEAIGCGVNVFRRSRIRAGDTVAVVGIGFIGAVVTRLAALAGARVIALSRREDALALGRRFGAAAAVPTSDFHAAIARVKDLTEGKLCDVVVEAVGTQAPLDLAAELTREYGRLVIAGYHQDGPRSVNMWLWNWRCLDVVNAHERDPRVQREGVELAARELADGRLDPAPLFTSYALDRIGDAFHAMEERPAGFVKALVTP